MIYKVNESFLEKVTPEPILNDKYFPRKKSEGNFRGYYINRHRDYIAS